jgi:hypothetical protein
MLSTVLLRRKPGRTRISRVKEQLDLSPQGVAETEERASEEKEDEDVE